MPVTSISPFIALHADRSALLDVKEHVLFLTLARILSRFDVELPMALRLLSGSDIRIRFDPANGNPCLRFEDIPRFLGLIRLPKNDYHNRQAIRMLLECEDLSIKLEFQGLLYLPRHLSRELISTLVPRLPAGYRDKKDVDDMLAFTREVAVR